MFGKGRMCPECGDDLPSVGRQLWQTNETPQDTASFLRIRCPSCQVDYCCGCLADWKSCAAQLCRPTFPVSDAPCAKGCAIGVFEILDALDRACMSHPLRAEEVPLVLKASCELLSRVLVHPFHGGDSHQAIGVLLAASRLPALLVLLFARTTATQLWIARAELYRAALSVLWRIVGTPEILVGLITLPRVLRTCGLRAWIAGEDEISWAVARDGSGGIKELVMVLAERRLELEKEMKGADAEAKKTLGLLVGDIIAVEKQAKLASRDRTVTLLAEDPQTPFAPTAENIDQPIHDNIVFQAPNPFTPPVALPSHLYQAFLFDPRMQEQHFFALQQPFFPTHDAHGQFAFPHAQFAFQQQMQPPPQMQQPQAEHVPGKGDYELLKQVKDAILSGQHEHYKPLPKPAALADLYMGQLPADLTARLQASTAARSSISSQATEPLTPTTATSATTNTSTNGMSQDHIDEPSHAPPRLQNKEQQRRMLGATATPSTHTAPANANGASAPHTNGVKPSGSMVSEPERPVHKPPPSQPVDNPSPVKTEPIDPKAVPPPPRVPNGTSGPIEKDPRHAAAKADAAARLAREDAERDRNRDRDRSLERQRERRDSLSRPDYRDRRLSDARRPVPGDRHYEPSSYDRPREEFRPRVDDRRPPPRDPPATYERASSAAPRPLAARIAPVDSKVGLTESKSLPVLGDARPATAAPRTADPIPAVRPAEPPRPLEDRIGPPPSSTRPLHERIGPAAGSGKPTLESRISDPISPTRRPSNASATDRGRPVAPVADHDRSYRPGSPARAVYPPRAASVHPRDDARSARGSSPIHPRDARPTELKPSTYRPGADDRYDRRRDSMDVDRALPRTIYDRAFSPPTPAQIALDQERARRSHYAPPASPPPPPRARVPSDAAYDSERRYPAATRDYYAYDRERVRELDDELYKRRERDRYERERDLIPPSRALWEERERERSPPRSVFDTVRPPLGARITDSYGAPVDDRYLDRRYETGSVRPASPPYAGRVRPRSPSPMGRRVGEPPEKRRREELYASEYLGSRAEYAPPPRAASPPRSYYDAPGSSAAAVARDYDRDYPPRSSAYRAPSPPPRSGSAAYLPRYRDEDRRYPPR
ncbi:hypothetical protein EV122DRAFT_295565 [Schizophyllum commune]